MRTLLAFMSGSAVTTVAVVMASGYQAGMVIVGGLLTLLGLAVVVRMLGVNRVSRWLLALQEANSETVYLERGRRLDVGAPQGSGEQPVPIRRSRAGQNVVTLPKVLAPVQQDVLSALVNQGLRFNQAEALVIECFETGDSFEDLFRRAIVGQRRTA